MSPSFHPDSAGPGTTRPPAKPISPGMDPSVWCTVRAAAGSGKTRLLVRRLLRVALEGSDPTRFLAVTFTNKAAAEMKERLLSASREFLMDKGAALAAELGLEVSSPKVSGFYWNLLDHFSRVRVSTIHAFCNEVVARFSWECNLAPQLKVLDTVQHKRMREICLSQFLNSPDWDDPATGLGASLVLLRAHGLRGNAIMRMLPALEGASNLWRAWLLEAMGEEGATDLDLDPLLWPDFVGRPSPRAVWDLPGKAEAAAWQETGHPAWVQFVEFLEGRESGRAQTKSELALRLKQLLAAGDLAGLSAMLPGLEGLAKPDTTKWRGLVAESEALASVRKLWIPELQRRGSAAAEAWTLVALEYLKAWQELKRRMGVIDFSDMEWIAATLLTRGDVPGLTQYVLYALSQRLLHLAVDEFQDTADLQWKILHHLAQLVSGEETGESGSAFCVGDVKQSIYRFRNAEPELMEVARTELCRLAAVADRSFSDLNLDVSYRSSAAVLELTAALFDPARGTALRLPAGESGRVRGYRQGPSAWGKVVVEPYFVAMEESVAKESEESDAAMMTPIQRRRMLDSVREWDAAERCALWCADLVQRLVKEEEPVFEPGLAAWRPARYRDILILLEARTHAESFESAFRRAGIPFVAAGKGAMESRTEFRDLMAVVNWVLRPMNDLAFTSLLRSPLFRISEEDLLALRRRPGVQEGGLGAKAGGVAADLFRSNWRNSGRLPSLWQVLQKRSEADVLPESLLDAQSALKRLEACWSKSPLELFVLLEREFALLGRYGGVFNAGVEANFRLFWGKAVELEAAGVGTLARFAEEMGLLASGEEFSDAPLPASDDAGMVRFLTVHGAKGLEAPIVIMPDTWRKGGAGGGQTLTVREPQTRQIRGVLPDLGALYPVVGTPENWPKGVPADPYRFAQQTAARRAEDERACLNYVAVTRARDHLYLGGFKSGTHSAPEANAEQASTLHVEAWNAVSWLGKQVEQGNLQGIRVCSEETDNNSDDTANQRLTLESGQAPVQLVRLPVEPLQELPLRGPVGSGVSVLFEEELASRGAVEEGGAEYEAQAEEWGGLGQLLAVSKAMARGNALHAVMEAAALWGEGVTREWAQRLVRQHLPISQEAAEVVDEAMALLADPQIAPYLLGPGLSEQPIIMRQSAKGVRFGIPDRVALMPGRVVILDFKTQRHPERVDKATLQKYAHQLRTYADLLRQILPLPGVEGDLAMPIQAFLLWTHVRRLEEVSI